MILGNLFHRQMNTAIGLIMDGMDVSMSVCLLFVIALLSSSASWPFMSDRHFFSLVDRV